MTGQRTHSIDRITPHCVVGQCTAEGLGEWFEKQSTQASSNYGIDRDGSGSGSKDTQASVLKNLSEANAMRGSESGI